MSYVPNNPPIYNAAFVAITGFYGVGALQASGAFATYARAWAAAVDTAWGPASYTSLDLDELKAASVQIWSNASPPTWDGPPTSADSYTTAATRAVAMARAGTAVVVAEGINPNATGGSGTDAALVTYTPAVGPDWNPDPAEVKAALDQLAADAQPNTLAEKNFAGIGPGTPTIAFNSTGTLSSKRKTVMVTASVTFNDSSVEDVTLTLQVDGADLPGQPATWSTTAAAGAGVAQLSATWIYAVPDNAAHHYGWQLTNGGGGSNLTVPIQGASVVVVDL